MDVPTIHPSPLEAPIWHLQFNQDGAEVYKPLAFTEQGVAMLSSVLNSKRAILVNIQIMRIFTRFRQMLAGHEELKKKIEEMEEKYDEQFKIVFDALRQLLVEEEQPKRKIGF